MKRRAALTLFLLGLGCETKVFFLGTISFSELAIFPLAPFIFLKQRSVMRREGFMPFVGMLFLLWCGMFFSSLWNQTPYPFVVKLFAVYYGFFAYFVVFYKLLRQDFRGLGWFFVGSAISGVITIWAFHPVAEVSDIGFVHIGAADMEDVVAGPLFWIGKIRSFGQLPIRMNYLKTPMAYSIVAPMLFVAFALFHSVSGRAQSVCVLLSGAMMLYGRKSRTRMSAIGRQLPIFIVVCGIAVLGYKTVYSSLAEKGSLGGAAQSKYEKQTEEGKGILKLLMSGRKEFFIGFLAAADHPLIGLGPRAEDRSGYTERFLKKYGSEYDLVAYDRSRANVMNMGFKMQIPTHSHIISAWLWCGLPGLLFWLWVISHIYRHIRSFSAAVPQWYGYFALAIPSMLWDIFFNPLAGRAGFPLLMVCMMFACAVGEGRMRLPFDMEMEARTYD